MANSKEKNQTFLLKLSDTLRAQTGAEAVGNRATQLIAQHLGADRVYLVCLNPDDDTVLVTHETKRQDMPPLQGSYRSSDFPAAIQEIFERTIIYTDVRTDARLTELDRQSFAGLGAVGFLATSIRRGNQIMIWAAGAVSSGPRSWTTSEVVLFENAVERTWAALERASVEEALRQSEDKYRTLFDSIDEGFCIVEVILDENGKPFDLLHLEANQAYELYTGLSGIVGKRSREIIPEAGPWLDFYGNVALTGQAARNESYLVAPINRWIAASASRIGGAGSLKVAIVFNDITERKRREANLAFLAEISQDLVKMIKPEQTLAVLGRKIGAHFSTIRVSFVEIFTDQNRAIVHDWHGPELSSVAGEYPLSQFLGESYRQLSRAGKPIVIPDAYQSDLVDGPQLEAVFGVVSFINIPLVRDEHWVFTLGIHATVPRDWQADEIDLLHELAARIWARLEKARAEEALQQSQERFESIANLVPDLLWESQPDGFTSWYNQRWLAYTGQRFEEAIGWGWVEAVHPNDREASVKRYKEAVATGTSLRQEHRIRRHDGAYRWFAVSTSPLKDQTGQVINIYGAATDIHESRLAEAALQESEKRFRLTIEATNLATWEWNLETDQVYWNEQHFRLFGMEPHPNPISPDSFMNHVHPAERERISHLLQQAIAERSVYEAEFCAILDDGSQRYMSGYGRITEEREGKPIRMSGVMMDVDERWRAEDALRTADRRKDEFLAMLAHELRNPLAPVRNGLQLVAQTHQQDQILGTMLPIMNRQMDHLMRMLDDLLDVSRISQGKIELHKKQIDLTQVASQAVEAMQPLYSSSGRELNVQLPNYPLYLDGDPTRIHQVVTNLLTNGLRYTHEGGQVWLTLERVGEQALVRVRDNGIGIAADKLTAIFELFVQVDQSLARSHGGLGLGLSLVQELVQQHGGRVEAHSGGLGQGSEFVVYLPLLSHLTRN